MLNIVDLFLLGRSHPRITNSGNIVSGNLSSNGELSVSDTNTNVNVANTGVSWSDSNNNGFTGNGGTFMETDNRAFVVAQLRSLCNTKFQSNMHTMFAHYAVQGKIGYDELTLICTQAGIGNFLTRPMYVKGIIAAIDKDSDGKISEDELNAAVS